MGCGRAISDSSLWVTLGFNFCALVLGPEGYEKNSSVSLQEQMAGAGLDYLTGSWSFSWFWPVNCWVKKCLKPSGDVFI